MKFFQRIREISTPKVQKILYLSFSALTTLFALSLVFVPFCNSPYLADTEGGMGGFAPIQAFSLLDNLSATSDGSIYLGFAVFAAWLVYAVVAVLLLVKNILRFNGKKEKIYRRSSLLCIMNAVATGVYFLGGIIFNSVNLALGGRSGQANNSWPFVVVLIVDLLFAFYVGVLKEPIEEEEDEPANVPKRKELKKRMLEFFLYATGIVACAMLAFFMQIISVTFTEEGSALASFNFSMSGADLLKDYASLETGSQILAFVIFLSLTFVLSFYFLALVALFSKSKAFFRFTLASVVASCIGCFIIGMYGKYYQMIQALSVETIASWLAYKYPTVSTLFGDLEALKEELLNGFEVTSVAFYYFLAALGLTGVLLARKPYSKGLILAKELEPNSDAGARIENAEIIVKQAHENDERVHTPSVSNGSGGFVEETPVLFSDPCPAFSELDEEASELAVAEEDKKARFLFEEPTLPKLVQFIVQYARDSRLHLFYTTEDVATFIAGLGTTKLSILQGMSGTGKTSLPKIFAEALLSNCELVEVESSWRDKNELLGYYNEFSKTYTPKKFTQALYKASLNPDTLTFIVLDEMNLSRIEYYFSDFLSLMENEPDKRAIKLLNVGLFRTEQGEKRGYKALERGHTLRVLPNVWFIGTANRDESTFEISDKVYDRAHTMNFNKRAQKVRCYNEPLPQRFLPVTTLNELLEEAKAKMDFTVEGYPLIAEVEKLLAPYNISFGNRIATQIESFVAVYCGCFTQTEEVIHDAVERILLSKVVSKLELKSVENKEELAEAFEGLGLTRCSEFISKLNEE